MNTLILGSYPPHPKRYSYQFYYPHTRNNFWKIIAHIAEKELECMEGEEAVIERKELMRKLNIGVENLGKEIQREGESALDTNIKINSFNDILGIIKSHSELQQILLPGFHAKSSTTQSFIRYLEENKVSFTKPLLLKPEQTFTLTINKRNIKCVILNSTSPAFKRNYLYLVPMFSKYLL